jgi:fructuronate reductase
VGVKEPGSGPSFLESATPRRPRFDRGALQPGIVHLGLGAFARAHLAVANDDAIEATGDTRFGIVGVCLQTPRTRDALARTAGRYTLALRDGEGEARREIGSLLAVLYAPDDPQAVLDQIADAATRVVSLTVTEKGYLGSTPGSTIDLVVRALQRRRRRGSPALTLMSLDNLAGNGHVLRRRVLELAHARDPALADWVDGNCSFPCSMVDRIVPRGDDPAVVHAEPFFDWAVEDRFAAGRPEWSAGGARFVDDAAPWEQLKLRMVNGAHSTIAYLGVAAGWATVDAAVADPALRRHLTALLRDEVEPTLPALPGLDPATYRARLLDRFANPALGHRTLQIAMDGSQKLPQRLLGTVRDRLARAAPIDRLALGIAAWLNHLRGHDDAGRPYALEDPLAADLRALHRQAGTAGDDRAAAALFTGYAPVFGDLAGAPPLVAALAPHLGSLRARGAAATLAALA